MPTTVDNRVVRMEFDNREFERNVRTSMHTIDELKRKLDFSGAADSFNDLERSARRVQFDELSDNIEKLTKRFDTWGIVAKTTIENITNKAVDSAERIVKALSIDQATAGLQKYEDKMTQLSSLMNSISDKDFLTGELDKNGRAIVDYGKKLEYVEEQLAKIYWYSDETSMDSNAMITSANTYLAAGQTMEEAIETLMGLSNWTEDDEMPKLSEKFKIDRSIRVIPIDDDKINEALVKFDSVVEKIETSIIKEINGEKIQDAWTAEGEERTCSACDFKTFCKNNKNKSEDFKIP